MKIAIVRGPSLNKFEMQSYEPLAKNHEVVCFTSTKPVYDVAGINLPIVRLPCFGQLFDYLPGGIRILNLFLGDPQGLSGLENKLAGFDLVHTAELFSYYTYQALQAKKRGVVKKVVATIWENIPFNQEWYKKQKALKKFALLNLDHIIAVSNLSKKMLIEEGYPKEKITVIPPGIDLEKLKRQDKDMRLLKDFSLNQSNFVILSVGRLVKEKGFYDFLLAAEKLLKDKDLKRHNLKFLIVGDGSEKNNLESFIKNKRIEKRVTILPNQPYDKMPKIYNLADLFVLNSQPTETWQEQFGMVLIEAMACGLPVISTKSGVIPETVGESGILVASQKGKELTRSLKRLILDSDLRKSFSEKGKERVKKNFDRQIVAKKINSVYQKVHF